MTSELTHGCHTPPRYIIGITGAKRTGKTTVANILTHYFNLGGLCPVALPLADPLKAACRVLFNLDDDQLWGDLKETEDPRWGATPREIMQWVGTECLRERLGSIMVREGRWSEAEARSFWLKVAQAHMDRLAPYPVIIPDVRFDNEARWVLSQPGGYLLRLTRQEAPGGDGHASERGVLWSPLVEEWPEKTATLANDEPLGILRKMVAWVVGVQWGLPLEVCP